MFALSSCEVAEESDGEALPTDAKLEKLGSGRAGGCSAAESSSLTWSPVSAIIPLILRAISNHTRSQITLLFFKHHPGIIITLDSISVCV